MKDMWARWHSFRRLKMRDAVVLIWAIPLFQIFISLRVYSHLRAAHVAVRILRGRSVSVWETLNEMNRYRYGAMPATKMDVLVAWKCEVAYVAIWDWVALLVFSVLMMRILLELKKRMKMEAGE